MRIKGIALGILIFTLASGIAYAQDPVTPNTWNDGKRTGHHNGGVR